MKEPKLPIKLGKEIEFTKDIPYTNTPRNYFDENFDKYGEEIVQWTKLRKDNIYGEWIASYDCL